MVAAQQLRKRDAAISRAKSVSREVFGWAVLSGTLSLVALSAYWIVMSQVVRVPSSVLPDMSMYPWLTVALMVVTGSLVSTILEQAVNLGLLPVDARARILRSCPPPSPSCSPQSCSRFCRILPMHSPLWPRLVFYFLTGAMLGVTAYLTKSILPGLIVHILGLLTFFVLVFSARHDAPLGK